MPSFGYSLDNFQRLEDFPLYTSVIRCFGKPIIPPLLTPQERLKISQLRSVLQEREVLKSQMNSKKKCRNSDDSNNSKHITCSIANDFPNQENSAFSSVSLKRMSNNSCENEMLVSMSRMSCKGICSTVHDSVIVCPNERKQHFNEITSTEPESNSEYYESYSENDCDCQTCQTKIIETNVPYKNALSEQIHSVSEDDRESVAEETEFGSLPTVICNKKIPATDTDSESIVTCMTQSTDLEKYLDCSVEFSSPDDLVMVSQLSNRSRSDDASTETIVNTENELTPCASAMAQLNIDGPNEAADASENILNTATILDVNNRAYSVDSYMNILKTCAKNLYLKKSQSEPFQYEANHPQNSFHTFPVPEIEDNPNKDSGSEPQFLSSNVENSEYSDDISKQADFNLLSDSELKPEGAFQRNHIRRNSYTLSHPSTALMMAHADCHCQGDPSVDASPHSCSSKQEDTLSNVAFKKETLNLVLPPVSDREKLFPVLNYNHMPKDFNDQDSLSNPEVSNSTEIIHSDQSSNSNFMSRSCSFESNSDMIRKEKESKTGLKENESSYKTEILKVDSIKENLKENKGIIDSTCDSILIPEASGSNRKDEFFLGLFEELKESHQLRVNQLIQEQNKQWLKLQEDFKNQERLLIEKLKVSGISILPDANGNNTVEQSFNSHVNFESSFADEQFPSHIVNYPPSRDSTSTASDTESYPTVIQNNLDGCHEQKHSEANFIHLNDIPQCPNVSTYTVTHKDEREPPINVDVENVNVPVRDISPIAKSCYIKNTQDQHTDLDLKLCYQPSFGSEMHSLTEQHITTIPVNLVENSDNCKQALTFPVILNDINSTSEANNYAAKNPPAGEINSVRKHLDVQIPKQTNELPFKINTRNISEVPPLKVKTNNVEKEGNIIKGNDIGQLNQIQTSSNLMVDKSKCERNEDSIIGNKNTNNATASRNCIEKVASSGFAACDSNLNNPRIKKLDSNNMNHQCIPHKSLVLPSLPVKAMKIVSSSRTNARQRISKDLNNPDVLKKFEKLPAFVKGYLTRRLFNTEKVQDLIKTMKETAILTQNLSEELTIKGNSLCEQDIDLYNRLIIQLLSTFENVYNIFCTISTKERMKIISESRNSRLKKKISEQSQTSNSAAVIDQPSSVPAQKQISSGTRKSLQRKRGSVGNINDISAESRESRMKTRSCCSQKSRSVSPGHIYQSSVGVNLNRKTKNCTRVTHPKHWK